MTHPNPAGTEGFEFLEFATCDPDYLHQQFKSLGFPEGIKHPQKALWLYQQGNIRFLLNAEPDTHADAFAKTHGPSVSGMAFRVKDAQYAFNYAQQKGALHYDKSHRTFKAPALSGVGGSVLYLIDKKEAQLYLKEFGLYPSHTSVSPAHLHEIDHVTHNLFRGNMDKWAKFYQDVFNFHEIRYFNISGQKTGLLSRAMSSPCGKIRIPLNESIDDKSQIEEFLAHYHGEGIQHIALSSQDACHSVDYLSTNGIPFLDVPPVYYDMVDARLPHHEVDLSKLRKRKILIDGNTKDGEKRLLLQIFTKNMIGPIFYEVIERRGDEGFGEGNFRALFEAIERDQMLRGVL